MHFIDWNAFWLTGLVSFYPGAVKSESPERGTGRTDQACKSGAVTLCLRDQSGAKTSYPAATLQEWIVVRSAKMCCSQLRFDKIFTIFSYKVQFQNYLGMCLLCGDKTRKNVGPILTSLNCHLLCVKFSSGILDSTDPPSDGEVTREVRRAQKLKCDFCHQVGAFVGCSIKVVRWN